MADKKITEYSSVDYNNSNTKVLGVKGGKTYLVQLGNAAEHDAEDFADADHEHDDYVKSVTINGIKYEPTNGDVSVSIQEGSGSTVDVDSALSSTSENPVQNKAVKSALDGKVDKVSGKGLSTNDYTTNEKNKLGDIESGAQVNVIESVDVNGVTATIDGKKASITIPVGDENPDLSNYIQKSETGGLLKNDGTVDTNTYLTQHQDISGKADKSELPAKLSELENDSRFIKSIETIEMNGYRQLFYIETNGTQCITTDIIPNQNTGFEIEFLSKIAPTATNAPQIVNAGGRGTQNRFAISMYKASGLAGEVMIKTTSINAKIDMNTRQILRYINDGTNKTFTYTDGTTLSVDASGEWTAKDGTGSGANNAPLILFGLKSGNSFDRCFSGRLYRLKIYNLETLAYDFVPAMRESDNVVGLYEAVNNVFYTDEREGVTFGYGDDEILNRVSQLIMDKNIVTDNNFSNSYKNKLDNANTILTGVPSADGTYVLKAVVSNGSITYNWVAE